MIIGFNQPDEDDYGYVSKDAMAIYNNIMNKYVNTPSETKNTKVANHRSHDISGTKVSYIVKNKIVIQCIILHLYTR